MKLHQVQKQLEKLKGWREILFTLALAERSYPNYVLFCELAEVENTKAYRALLDALWRALEEKTSSSAINALLLKLERLVPDAEAYDMYGVKPALDSCALVESVMFGWLNPENRRALEASQSSLATVTDFIEYAEGEGLDEDELVELFDAHPFVVQESEFQSQCFRLIKPERYPTRELLQKVKRIAANEGVSNIGIALD
ncbi:MAG: YjaG family protein [Pseudomonadales bacterium]|nr:YjaG family protein [Pseudomonadales bacterium]